MQYITSTYIENKGDAKPPIELDHCIAPDICLRIGAFSIHFTADRLSELGRVIGKWESALSAESETAAAQADTQLPAEVTPEPETPETPFD